MAPKKKAAATAKPAGKEKLQKPSTAVVKRKPGAEKTKDAVKAPRKTATKRSAPAKVRGGVEHSGSRAAAVQGFGRRAGPTLHTRPRHRTARAIFSQTTPQAAAEAAVKAVVKDAPKTAAPPEPKPRSTSSRAAAASKAKVVEPVKSIPVVKKPTKKAASSAGKAAVPAKAKAAVAKAAAAPKKAATAAKKAAAAPKKAASTSKKATSASKKVASASRTKPASASKPTPKVWGKGSSQHCDTASTRT